MSPSEAYRYLEVLGCEVFLDADLFNHCIRIVHDTDNDKIVIEAEVISWPHPHEPHIEWIPAMDLPATSTPAEVDQAAGKVLRQRRFFKVCKECRERKLSGLMWEEGVCQACAERNHGVVF